MSPPSSPGPLRTFAFGAPSETRWLAGWFLGSEGFLLMGDGDGVAAREADLQAGPDAAWHVRATGAEVAMTAASLKAVVAGAEGVADGFEQAASCDATLDGASLAVPGRRGERAAVLAAESVRDVAAWFDDGGVVALTALRPRKAKGHEHDAVHAAVVDPDGFGPVIAPRLSTTYTEQGRIRRVALELWSEDEDAPAVRLAAEAVGRGGRVRAGGWELTVDWLLAHRRGHDGAGVYLLAQPA